MPSAVPCGRWRSAPARADRVPETSADAQPTTRSFDDPDAAALVRNEPVARALTRNHRRFNQLAERLQKLRTEQPTWQRAVDRYRQRAAENVQPLQRELLAEQRAAVLVLDELLCSTAKGERLTRARRTRLAELVVVVAGAVLQSGPDREIEAVFDRHSELSYDEMQRAEVDLAEAVFGQVLGEDAIAGHGASSVEELIDHAGKQLHSKLEAEGAERRERAGRGVRAVARPRASARPASRFATCSGAWPARCIPTASRTPASALARPP